MSGLGVLAMTMVVRDEQEILATNLDHHLAQGVDVILVVDHASSDGTSEILAGYAETGRVHFWRDEDPGHRQAARVNRLLAIAAQEHGAAWVLHADADEFWMPVAGCLRDVFATVPGEYGYMKVPRHDFAAPASGDGPFHQQMVLRHRASTHLSGSPLLPKIAQRPAAGDRVDHGNHNLVPPRLPLAPDLGLVEILHFQTRSFEQYERKVIKLGLGLEAVSDPPPEGVGFEARELLAMHRRDELRSYYDSRTADPGPLTEAGDSGELDPDHRLRRFLAVGPEPAQESRAIQAWLSDLWSRHAASRAAEEESAELRVRCAELTARCAALTGEREALQAELEASREAAEASRNALEVKSRELDDAQALVATIRASAVMRYTAHGRRIYYRLRPRRMRSLTRSS